MNWFFKSLLLPVLFHLTSTSVSNGLPNFHPTNLRRLRRDVAENNTVKNVRIGIVERCMHEMDLKSKEVSQLEPEQIGQLIGKINTKYAYLESCTRRLVCSTVIRSRILSYAKKYLPSPELVHEMMGNIEKQIKEDFMNTSETLINGVSKLARFANAVAQYLPQFLEIWNQMKAALESTRKETRNCRTMPSIGDLVSLPDIITKFTCAEDFTEALHYYKKKGLFWKKLHKRITDEDDDELKLLAYDEIILRTPKRADLSSKSEIEYGKDLCKLEKLWLQKPAEINDKGVYAQCMGVVYFSSDPDILDLKKNLSSDSSKPSHVHNHQYCNDQSALWTVVSDIYEHTHTAEVEQSEDFRCIPGEEDFEGYMKFLDGRFKNNRFSYVARSLI